MAEFLENIATIRRAIYGKEMRPAIYEALLQDWEAVNKMVESVDKLNSRADNLSGGGGSDVDGSIIINSALPPSTLVTYGCITPIGSAGVASLLGD